jgi:hypothetical protein
MTRTKRVLLLVVAGALGLASTAVATPAMAAAKPVIIQLSATSGPLRSSTIVIRGRNLSGVRSVTFGSRAGVVVRKSSSTAVTVRTPDRMPAGTVSVRVKTAAGWSALTSRGRYTFVAPPAISKVSPSSGTFVGGTLVTFTGKHLETATRVVFGKQAATIVSRRTGLLAVRTPIGTLGTTKVIITTQGGAVAAAYVYVKPAERTALTVTANSATFVAGPVEWVTGGYDPAGNTTKPWQVGLPKGVTAPAVGRQFLLRPGGAVFPSGLAGTVTEVAEQLDESVRVTVAPTDLTKALTTYSLDYTGPVVDPSAGISARLAGKAAEFAVKGPTPLKCTDPLGREVTFAVELTTTVTDVDVDQHVDMGSLFSKPSFDGTVTAELQTTGKITVSSAASCKLKTEWVNANRKIIPLGASGATLSFAPAFEIKISAKGTWTVVDRTRLTFAVHAKLGKTPTFTRDARTVSTSQTGELTFTENMTGGVSIQLGILDRAGLQGKLQIGVDATVKASTAPNVCVDADVYGSLQVSVFFDAFVARWEKEAFSARIGIAGFHQCLRSADPSPTTTGEPEITSSRLPDATIGSAYATGLTTRDGRAGTWSLVRSTMPAGLSLSAGGTIAGTPTGPVGDFPLVVDFRDAAGKVATTTVRLQVLPATIGGGDVQTTLRWNGAADLDLHVFDPSGEEIYYRNTISASGGRLDHDANADCNGPADDDNPVENVYWPTGKAPRGTYTVVVRVYKTCDAPVDWHLSIRRNGAVIVNQDGTGDSGPFTFTVGTAAAAARLLSTPMINSRGSGK